MRSGRMALAGLAGGVMLAVAVISVMDQRSAVPAIGGQPARVSSQGFSVDLARCRQITDPDTGCDAVWEANRRRFFGDGKDSKIQSPGSSHE